MEVFTHHLYEYKKGLRNLVLHTFAEKYLDRVISRLVREGIDYKVYSLGRSRVNLFFGASECVEIIQKIGKARLNKYSPEEDFILGIMLGYARKAQCTRYLKIKSKCI